MKNGVDINVKMITWAISRAGHDLHEFTTGFPKVQEWIENKSKPTLKQLETFSKKVHIPFGYLFLANPPEEHLPIPFFRTNNPQNHAVSINVYDTILSIQRRQEWLIEYMQNAEFQPLKYVGKFHTRHNPAEIVADIRKTLGLSHNWASEFQTWQDALQHLTQKIEEVGIIMVFNGVFENSTNRPINVDECRGFVLVDKMAPFMFINNADGKAAQLFTIVHELAHIWTGHSAGFDFRNLQPANDPNELLCDKVAAEFLVPAASFNEFWMGSHNIKSAVRYFKVSEIVIARRALDTGKITRDQFFEFYNEYISRENFKKEHQSSGGDFYATTKKRLGLSFAAHINNAVKADKLLYRDAYKLTGLKGDTFQTFFSKHFQVR
ncbi:MAG TPA: ImmA/IrrE family metallo-endopeptidase [Paludibacter sp.]